MRSKLEESERLRGSRERLKAALELTRREIGEEVGTAPGGRFLLPLVGGAVGLVLAWGTARFLGGRRQRRLSGSSESIDMM